MPTVKSLCTHFLCLSYTCSARKVSSYPMLGVHSVFLFFVLFQLTVLAFSLKSKAAYFMGTDDPSQLYFPRVLKYPENKNDLPSESVIFP